MTILTPEHKSLFIHNEWTSGYGKVLTSKDPYNNQVIYSAKAASKADVTRAVRAARAAFFKWSVTSLEERMKKINLFKKALERRMHELMIAIAQETGKPLWEAKNEVSSMIHKVDLSFKSYADRCRMLEAPHALTRHKPHGVVAVFGPFNFPGHLPNGHIVPALLAGNTVVFKASEHAPLTAELTVQCWQEADLPSGTLNLLQGDGTIGKALAEDMEVNGFFFTGSRTVGESLLKLHGSQSEKILALEMGGVNSLVVSSIDDIDAAIYNTIQSAFITAGQRCSCARRLIVIESDAGQTFIEKLLEKTASLRIGHFTLEPEPFMGPLISESAAIRTLISQAALEARGATALLKLEHLQSGTGRVTPGIIDVTAVGDLPDEEIFAPFLQLIWVDNMQEAVQKANQTAYGLAAGLLSNSKKEYEYFYRSVNAGIINWNRPLTGASSAMPFGGIGQSGNFRPSAYYAADYCSYPVASMESEELKIPEKPTPGYF